MIRLILAVALCITYLSANSAELSPNHIETIKLADEQSYALHLFEPTPSNRSDGIVLTVHGGGWKWGSPQYTYRISKQFADSGLTAISIDYRLSQNGLTPIDAYKDVCHALEWIRDNKDTLKINPNKVAALGVSAGGHLSALAATKGCKNNQGSFANGGPDLLLLWSPALDMENDGWFSKLLAGKATAKAFSPLVQLSRKSAPTLIVQGDKDTLTPLKGAQKYCDKANQHYGDCQLAIYPGVGHLLTRNLSDQESNFDPHPEYQQDGVKRFIEFLTKHRFLKQ